MLLDDDNSLLGDGYVKKENFLDDDDDFGNVRLQPNSSYNSNFEDHNEKFEDKNDEVSMFQSNEDKFEEINNSNHNYFSDFEQHVEQIEQEIREAEEKEKQEIKADFDELQKPVAADMNENDLEFDSAQDMVGNANIFEEGEKEELFKEEEKEEQKQEENAVEEQQNENVAVEEQQQNENVAVEEQQQNENVAVEEQQQNENVAAEEEQQQNENVVVEEQQQQQNIDVEALQKQAQEFELEEIRKEKEDRELSGEWDKRDKYNELLENRIDKHIDGPEIVEIKRNIFRLKLAVQGLDYEGVNFQAEFEEFKLKGEADAVQPSQQHSRRTAKLLFSNLIESCEQYIGTHRGKSKSGGARLDLVRGVMERAKADLKRFTAVLDVHQGVRAENQMIPNLQQALLTTLRSGEMEDKFPHAIERKVKGSKTRAKDLGELVSALSVLNKDELARARGHIAKNLVTKFADKDFLKDFAKQRNETLGLLADKFRLYMRQDVPKSFLGQDGQDPSDLTLRRQFALAKIRTDRLFYQLSGMDEMLRYLSPSQQESLKRYVAESSKDMSDEMKALSKEGIKIFGDKTDLTDLNQNAVLSLRMVGDNEIKKILRDTLPQEEATENMRAHLLRETIERVFGQAGYDPNDLSDVKIDDVRSRDKVAAKHLAAVKKQLTAEVNRIVDAKCKELINQSLDDLCNVKSDEELRHLYFTTTDPVYLQRIKNGEDVSNYSSPVHESAYAKASIFVEEKAMAAGKNEEEKSSRIATGRPVMQRAVLHSQMSELLGLQSLSPRAKFDKKEEGGQVKNGVKIEAVNGLDLFRESSRNIPWAESAKEDKAKLLALNFLCGNLSQANKGYVCDEANGQITKIRMAANTQLSFGKVDSDACVKALGKDGMAMLIMLDEATKEKIRTMGPITLASHFGYALDASEMKALSDRLAGLQKLIKSIDGRIRDKQKMAEKKIEKYRAKLRPEEKNVEEVDNFRNQIQQQQRDLVTQLRAAGVSDDVLIPMDEYITKMEDQKRKNVLKANENVKAIAKSEDIAKMVRKNDQEMNMVVKGYRQTYVSTLADYKESIQELVNEFKACTTAEQVENTIRAKDSWEIM